MSVISNNTGNEGNNDPIITPEFSELFDLLETSKQNIFLTGKAGTGKSTFLQYFRQHSKKKMAVLAPTGVAALNVQGQTIHSFFRLKPSFIDIANFKPIRQRIFKEVELLVIDEISMVRADIFDAMDLSLRTAHKNDQPFGGVQVCVIGDLFQLPPVVSREEQAFYGQFYQSSFFFHSHVYEKANFKIVEFHTIHRQSDDEFIRILNNIRNGTCNHTELAAINSRVIARVTAAPGTLILTTTNALAENINATKLDKLPGEVQVYNGLFSGEFDANKSRLPAAEKLILKVGAQVMLTKNDNDMRWVNGTLATVEKLSPEIITIKIGDISYQLGREKWQSISFEFDQATGMIVEKILGTYTQFPLVLAWAITIHKSQGKTLERVIIDLGNGAFAAGQLYVALSRCKTLNGIALKRPIKLADIHCDEQLLAFMRAELE
jgi:hypothetical protein